MDFLKDILVAIITSYLAFTNFLATEINDLFTADIEEPTVLIENSHTPETENLSWLPSFFSSPIPDVLLRSAEYQQAAIGDSAGLSGATTDDPLKALVNIFCTFTTDSYIRTTTGTGFFIDPDGVILTNAHVAQFLLFETTADNGETECVVRTGNPASPKYHAELLYIPPAWVQKNAAVMTSNIPMGTGERDYALLYTSRTVDDSLLPAVFPALSVDTKLLPVTTRNTAVTAAGYPASELIEHGPETDLLPKIDSTSISELYTFGSNYADVFSIRGSNVGAEGASGGPVVDKNGNVIGVIVTRGDDGIDGAGSLRAITLSHIERSIQQETGFSLAQNISGNLPYRAEVFAKTLSPFLLTILQQNNF